MTRWSSAHWYQRAPVELVFTYTAFVHRAASSPECVTVAQVIYLFGNCELRCATRVSSALWHSCLVGWWEGQLACKNCRHLDGDDATWSFSFLSSICLSTLPHLHLLLPKNPELFDILVPACPGWPRNCPLGKCCRCKLCKLWTCSGLHCWLGSWKVIQPAKTECRYAGGDLTGGRCSANEKKALGGDANTARW